MADKFMSRRSFVQGTGVAAGAMAAFGLVGCGGSSSSTTDENGNKKKILRFGQANAKIGLDMQKSSDSLSSTISESVFEAPLRWTEDNELVANLLTEVPSFEDDGVTLKCTLKNDIKCHDGSTLTADDVKYTFERMFTPATGAYNTYMYDKIAGAKEMLAGTATELSGIVVEDDTHFTITLTEPMASFISNLGISYAQIFPKAACEAAGDKWGWGTDCVGTGKYKIVSNDDTTEVVLEAFADYHDGAPDLDEIDVYYYDDNNTKLLAYKNGDIDWCDLSTDILSQYKSDPDTKDQITLYDTLGVYFVNLNLNSDKLKDVRVREALSIAIDRQSIVDNTLSGAGEPAGCWLASATPGHDSSANLDYDPERAKQLLSEAGASGLTLDCKVRPGLYENVMTVIQSYWAEVGVTVNVTVEDSSTWNADWKGGNLETTFSRWFPLFADADNHMYTYFYSENAKGKSSFYNSEKFDELVTAARVSQDSDERASLYKQADHLLTHEDFATIPVFWPKGSFVAKPYVKNAKVGNLIYHFYDLSVDPDADGYPA